MSRMNTESKIGTLSKIRLLVLMTITFCAIALCGCEGLYLEDEDFQTQWENEDSGENSGENSGDASYKSDSNTNDDDKNGGSSADADKKDTGSSEDDSNDTNQELEPLTIDFIDVGQGSATLITCGEEAMLIDAGNNSKGTTVQSYIKKKNIKNLKYVIGTHPDSDHIGGLDVIISKFNCENILMTDEKKDTKTYNEVIDAINYKSYKITNPVVGEKYTLCDAQFTIASPSVMSSDSNNNSIVIIVEHGNNSFLIGGDQEEEAEKDMIDANVLKDVDVYLVGHHGSNTSSSEKFLNAITPEYAVISVGEGNSYGHPKAGTLNTLRSMGVSVFRTDEQGSIQCVSDGENITWNCSPSDTWQAGE